MESLRSSARGRSRAPRRRVYKRDFYCSPPKQVLRLAPRRELYPMSIGFIVSSLTCVRTTVGTFAFITFTMVLEAASNVSSKPLPRIVLGWIVHRFRML